MKLINLGFYGDSIGRYFMLAKRLFALTVKKELGPNCQKIKEQMKIWNESDSGIYWYPGSGFDLMPLALDMPKPKNILATRIFPVDEKGPLLVLSDCGQPFIDAITGVRKVEEEYPYQERYEELGHKISIDKTGGLLADVIINGKKAPAAIFFVEVSSPKKRKGTDLYLVVAIGAETSQLWAAILDSSVPVITLAIVKAGGFSGHEKAANALVAEMARLQENHPCKAKNLIFDNSILGEKYSLEKMKGHIDGWGFPGVDLYRFTK